MIDHVCAHMQKMSNKKEITYTIQACDCTHYAVGRVLLLLTNSFGMRYHSGVLVPHPGINSSNNVTRIEVFTHLFVRCL